MFPSMVDTFVISENYKPSFCVTPTSDFHVALSIFPLSGAESPSPCTDVNVQSRSSKSGPKPSGRCWS